jgi:hypothetical protein
MTTRTTAIAVSIAVLVMTGMATAQYSNTESDIPTYNGEPRSYYSYTGDETDVFEQWQEGQISTNEFQRDTARGEGTAALELDNQQQSSTTRDPDGDGLLEDFNGDGEVDGNDPIDLAFADDGDIDDVSKVDFNDNGEFDFDDSNTLKEQIKSGVAVFGIQIQVLTENPQPGEPVEFDVSTRTGSDVPPGFVRIRTNNGFTVPSEELNSGETPSVTFEQPGTKTIKALFLSSEYEGDEDSIGNEDKVRFVVGNEFKSRASDPDDDGLFEDFNGDGEVTTEDSSELEQRASESSFVNPAAFDFDEDGSDVDFGDAAELTNQIENCNAIPEVSGTITGRLDGEGEGPPTDPDNDGLFEDVNGNGRIDRNDAIGLAFAEGSCVENNVDELDFDGDSDFDFDDATTLARQTRGKVDTGQLNPNDPDGDSLFEDVNGDDEVNFDDAIELAFITDKDAQNFNFDFNADGNTDFDDAKELAEQIEQGSAVSDETTDPPSRDPDDDGLVEDVDSDGDTDFEDAVELAFRDNPDADRFDFDGDGDVDFEDARELSSEVAPSAQFQPSTVQDFQDQQENSNAVIEISEGWSLVSAPSGVSSLRSVIRDECSVGTSGRTVWRARADVDGYAEPGPIRSTGGYWVNLESSCSFTTSTTSATDGGGDVSYSEFEESGYYMVSVPEATSLDSVAGSCSFKQPDAYNGPVLELNGDEYRGLSSSTELSPTKGYWVGVQEPCQMGASVESGPPTGPPIRTK